MLSMFGVSIVLNMNNVHYNDNNVNCSTISGYMQLDIYKVVEIKTEIKKIKRSFY